MDGLVIRSKNRRVEEGEANRKQTASKQEANRNRKQTGSKQKASRNRKRTEKQPDRKPIESNQKANRKLTES
jgi:hypothetical protein